MIYENKLRENTMLRYCFYILLIGCSFQSSAATLDIEIQSITEGGMLHLAIYNSKEVFESDQGDNPDSKRVIESGVVKKLAKALIKDLLKSLQAPMQLVYMLTKMKMENLTLTF